MCLSPPYVPKLGDKIRYLSLCHPNTLGKVKEVTDVTPETLKVIWVGTKDGERYRKWRQNGKQLVTEQFSSGILGEVEKVE